MGNSEDYVTSMLLVKEYVWTGGSDGRISIFDPKVLYFCNFFCTCACCRALSVSHSAASRNSASDSSIRRTQSRLLRWRSRLRTPSLAPRTPPSPAGTSRKYTEYTLSLCFSPHSHGLYSSPACTSFVYMSLYEYF
jgi:hypothetical protein